MEIYSSIYNYCSRNDKLLKQYQNCTCLYCGQNFNYNLINEWIDDKDIKTAICPYCHIDSVVPTEVNNGSFNYQMTEYIRNVIKNIYFGG